jgi:hypothetical protein
MRHFHKIYDGVDVAPLLGELDAQPELWDFHTARKDIPAGPHSLMSDVWIRYRAIEELTERKHYKEPHLPVWYPAWHRLPALHPIVFDMMARTRGEILGGVLITRIPPGEGIAPHTDDGWHVDYYDKFYLSLRSEPGADFVCDGGGYLETLNPRPGEVYLFDNRKNHWVENESDSERITLIVCIRTEQFLRKGM